MSDKKTSWYLVALGAFLIAFSWFASSQSALSLLHDSLRQGKVANSDLVFWLQDLRLKGFLFGGLLCAAGIFRAAAGDAVLRWATGGNLDETALLAPSSRWSAAVDLFLISFVALFAELLIIRWLAVEMRIFAYFKNVPLISCFLGMGLGAAMGEGGKKFKFASFPFWFSLFAMIIVFVGPRFIFVNPGGSDEYIWGIGKTSSAPTQLIATLFFMGIVLFVFIWNTRLFISLGCVIGKMLTQFPPLTAYSINIVGSLIGVLCFTVISYFSTPPWVWFAVTLASFLYFLRKNLRYLALMLAASAGLIAYLQMRHEPHQVFWSPYYKITLIPSEIDSRSTGQKVLAGYALHVNEDSHQTGMNYSDAFIREHVGEAKGDLKTVLELPFRTARAKTALIVGTGMGNDVAAALRAGVEQIDAVEIDPMILKIGKQYHPEHPYDSPKVTAINDDARSYFKKSKKKYDIVVFGILDSHTQFSSLSNLRLDNYVYTVESLRDAKALLNPGGIISITFGGDAKTYWMGSRFYSMMKEIFGKDPVSVDLDRMMFINGETLTEADILASPAWAPYYPSKRVSYDDAAKVPPATDDWPYIYMRTRQVPQIYLLMIVMLCAIAWIFMKKYVSDQKHMSPHFFFLGSAFLLLETKAVAELALVFGTTWIVNAVVFSAIMVLILIGNWAVSVFKIRTTNWAYALLCLSLLVSYFFRVADLAGSELIVKIALSTFWVLLPIFFASIVFAVSFSKTDHVPSAFGSNLLGAVAGGFLEYASLAIGLRSLALLALAFYLISLAALKGNWKIRI